ncbi:AraC family transcriptional regulator [Paraburkholderia edwinii]|uniref:AraC family transcriptional regulator n=1 Tax=Paraburkholderia edwinii TaxID=2861782 RepID=A0ABX8UFX2_9BURK|nr:AraC family transcriptional regulator [Paraburkholderia edwinii]QYD67761.1 AraC family transcriptional regulator [Paraburkholderia edwinii]
MFELTSSGEHVLDHLLAAVDLGVANFSLCDVRKGWGVSFEACSTVSLHYCLSGSATLVMDDVESLPLDAHSFVLLPAGVAYRIDAASRTAARVVDRTRVGDGLARETAPTVTVGDGAQGVVTACGELNVDGRFAADPFKALGRPLVTRFDASAGLRDQFVLLLAESARPGPGSRVLVEALLKQCLVMALRRHISDGGVHFPWAAGLADTRLAAALETMFERYASPLSVERLAQVASMSRSAFAAQFAKAFDQSPMAMLKIVRLRKAAELLATTTLPVPEVARAVGLSSRSNFSVAFQHMYHVDPTRFRLQSRSANRFVK